MRGQSPRLLVVIAAFASVLAGAHPAFCTETTDFIRGDTACPNPKAVEAEVFKLTSAEGRAAHLPGARVRVFDEGNRYGVEIEKDSETYRKGYDDPARACDQRARTVAVTVVLTLIPAEFSTDAPETPASEHTSDIPRSSAEDAEPRTEPNPMPVTSAPTPEIAEETPEAPPPSSAPASRLLQVEAGGWFQHSIPNSEVPRIAVWGGELLGAFGTADLAGLLALSAGGSPGVDLGEIRASLFEVTARAGVRLLWPARDITFALDAAFVGARRWLSAEAPHAPDGGAGWELGGSVGVNLAFAVWRQLAPIAGFRLNVFPVPSELEVAPRGTIGTLPKFWAGAHAGVRFGL